MTAVEWLVEEVEVIYNSTGISRIEIIELYNKAIEQAKEMEKNQIMDAYKADLYPCSDEDAEQYYNETFKSE